MSSMSRSNLAPVVLVTGFEPFGGNLINPSFEAVKLLPENIAGITLVKCCLPVTFGKASDVLETAIREISPRAVICTGLAENRFCITPELLAINLRDARIPDSDGCVPHQEKISENGADVLFSTLPVYEMVEKMRKNEISSAISLCAGTYVCNEVLYRLLLATKTIKIQAGFVHVPCIPEMGPGRFAIELEEIACGLQICIGTVIDTL